MTTEPTIGVDIGGTKVRAGVVDDRGRVLAVAQRRTPASSTRPVVVEDTIVEAVEELAAGSAVPAVGIGAAGFVDASGSSVRFSPHLSWRDEPLAAVLAARLGLPVVLDNDANTTAWAECRFGAGRGHRHVLCLTLGTGIGGALVAHGSVFRGANGMAGEFGHMQVVPGGRDCECGNRGCWEQYASGNALAREAVERGLASEPGPLTGQVVTEHARAGAAAALESFDEVGGWLGTGVAGLVAAFDPELVVVGGGVSQAGDLLLDPARRALRRTLTGRGYRPEPPIVRATLGVDAALVGAADLARERVSG